MNGNECKEHDDAESSEEERRLAETLRQLTTEVPVSPDFCARVFVAVRRHQALRAWCEMQGSSAPKGGTGDLPPGTLAKPCPKCGKPFLLFVPGSPGVAGGPQRDLLICSQCGHVAWP